MNRFRDNDVYIFTSICDVHHKFVFEKKKKMYKSNLHLIKIRVSEVSHQLPWPHRAERNGAPPPQPYLPQMNELLNEWVA